MSKCTLQKVLEIDKETGAILSERFLFSTALAERLIALLEAAQYTMAHDILHQEARALLKEMTK